MITLYKLRSGETVIGVFVERTKPSPNADGLDASRAWVQNPMIINAHSEIVGPWMPGVDTEGEKFPIPDDHILFYLPEEREGIQEGLLQEYKTLIEYNEGDD